MDIRRKSTQEQVGNMLSTSASEIPAPILRLDPNSGSAVSVGLGSASESDSAIQELNQSIESLRQQLEQARRMATLGELTGTATHEFNNLLMTILNYSKLGLRHKDEATRDKALQRIHDAAGKAGKLTGSILALARNRSGSMEPTNLRQIVEDTVLLLEREFRKYQLHLESQLDEVPEVMGQGNELQRLLINLLVNARQATAAGGYVRVTLKANPEAGEVVLTVRDNGTGISQDVIHKIFDPYFSTKSGPDASGRGGTGVGLALCKEIVDAHRGRIRVETALGKGTAFSIRLPIADTLPSADRVA
jgi:two-component system NtrC family sensor kinase